MTPRSLLILLSVVILSSAASGKDPFTKKELPNGLTKKATLKLADRYYAESIFYTAADDYRLYLQRKPNDRYATYWLAMSLYYARDYQGAEEQFQAFYALQPGPKDKEKWKKQDEEYFKQGRLFYGMALHREGKYEEAKQQIEKFRIEYYTNDPAVQTRMLRIAKLEMEGCAGCPIPV
jgi:TolA-binding protein